jgi:hypothetical protein
VALLLILPDPARAQNAACAQLMAEVDTLARRGEEIVARQAALRAALQNDREQQAQLELMSNPDLNTAIVDQIDRVRNAQNLETLAADRRRLDALTQVKSRRVLGDGFERPFARDMARRETQIVESEKEAVETSRRELSKRAELALCQGRFPSLSIAPGNPAARPGGTGVNAATGAAEWQFPPASQP